MLLFLYYTESCQDGQLDDSICNTVPTDNTSSCVSATLQCENMMCSAVISNYSRTCHFTNIGDTTISQPIQCCYCNNSVVPTPWWDCENITIPSPSLTPTKSYSTNSESLTTFLEYWGRAFCTAQLEHAVCNVNSAVQLSSMHYSSSLQQVKQCCAIVSIVATIMIDCNRDSIFINA